MSEIVRCGLIQCGNPINDESVPVADIQQAMLEKEKKRAEEARARVRRRSRGSKPCAWSSHRVDPRNHD